MKIVGKTPARPGNEGDANQPAVLTLNVEVNVPLQHLSNFQRFLDLPLTNCEIELDLSWKEHCVLTEHHNNITRVDSVITNTKLYVPVVTWCINDNSKFRKNIKQGSKRAISWNKYRSEKTTQTKNNNLDHLIDPTFKSINRLFFPSFKNVNYGIILMSITCH